MPDSAVHEASTPEPIFVSVRDAAQRLGMKTWDVYELVRAGELAYVQHTPKGKIHVLAADIPRWASERAAAARKDVPA